MTMKRIVILLTTFLYLCVFASSACISPEKKHEKELELPPPPSLAHVDFPPFKFNTADIEPHYIKMTVSLGFENNPALGAELKSRQDQILHIIDLLAREKRIEDLNSLKNLTSFSLEIKARINVILVSGKIQGVYFTEFIRH
jgi:flagellar basal body-associated protein FliL